MEDSALSAKKSGNAAFAANHFTKATECYETALAVIQSLSTTSARELRGSLLHNRSLCNSRLGNHTAAESDAQQALMCRPQWTKALYRLAETRQRLLDFEGAISPLKTLLSLTTDTKRRAALHKRMTNLQKRLEKQNWAEQGNSKDPTAKRDAILNHDDSTDEEQQENVSAAAEQPSITKSPITPIDLGYVEEGLDDDWKLWDVGKCGGRPRYLVTAPALEQSFVCDHCKKQMLFLCQIYAPIPGNPRAFHRALYLFTCRNGKCLSKANGGAGATKVIRMQLPRDALQSKATSLHHDAEPATAPALTSSSKADVRDPRCDEQNNKNEIQEHLEAHVVVSLPEMQLFVEEEPDECSAHNASSRVEKENSYIQKLAKLAADGDGSIPLTPELTQADLNDALGSHMHHDPQVRRFQQRIRRSGEQCLRYCLWENRATLWANSKNIPKLSTKMSSSDVTRTGKPKQRKRTKEEGHGAEEGYGAEDVLEAALVKQNAIPSCECCGAERRFELQMMPQLLYCMDTEGHGFLDFDWDTIVVFTCSNTCDAKLGKAFCEEIAWVQTSVNPT